MSNITIDEVSRVVGPIVRKYDWRVSEIKDGVRLTVSDGQAEAGVDITTGEDIESEAKRLIEEVDKHNYTVIG